MCGLLSPEVLIGYFALKDYLLCKMSELNRNVSEL